jgi:SRSO17 transposase
MGMMMSAGATQPPPSGLPPVINLAPRDVAGLGAALRAYHALFAPFFQRVEQRRWALQYLQGQMLELERKTIEPMALALEAGNVQAMQQFISVGAWQDDPILAQHHRLVAETLGDLATGVLIIDGCDFPKQGRHSVGVARQYCGALGKVANCQASVVACYASARGYTLVDRRLYLPEDWFGGAYRDRWVECGVPDGTPFQTQPELAWQLIDQARQWGALPFQWVTFDEHFGNNPALLDRIAGDGLSYLAEVPRSTRVWLERPRIAVPVGPGRGRPPSRERLAPGEPEAVRVDHLAAQIAATEWVRYEIKEGAKGPLVADFAFRRAVAVRGGRPGPDVGVVFRRGLGEAAEIKCYLTNAPATTPAATLVRVSGMRWPVETSIQECKGEVGLDHYEVRGWVGWHHHTALTLLAHHFLVRLRVQLGEKISGVDRPASSPVADGGAAETAAGRPDGPQPAPLHPAPELRGLLLPPQGHPAPPRFVLAKLTL